MIDTEKLMNTVIYGIVLLDLGRYIDAPAELRRRVQSYHDLKFASHQSSASALIQELPSKLQVAVLQQKYGLWINRVAFLKDLDHAALVEVCGGIETVLVMPGLIHTLSYHAVSEHSI